MKIKGKNKISSTYVITNLSFLIGIGCFLFLIVLNPDSNSPMWLLSSIVIMAGVLFSVIPDILVNLHIGNISICRVRMDLITKIVIILLLNNKLEEDDMLFMLATVFIFIIINLCIVYLVWKQLRPIEIGINEMTEIIRKAEGRNSDQLLKCLVINALSMALFLNMQDTKIERIIYAIICIAIHFYASEKLLIIMKNNAGIWVMKYRIILWMIHGVTMFMCVWRREMLCYVLEGVYWLTAIDVAMGNETAIINKKIIKDTIESE